MDRDILRKLWGDVLAGFGLLSRLPLPPPPTPRADAAWCWPLVGTVLGAIVALAGFAALSLGLPAPVAAGLCLCLSPLLTGALHEDGLADSADGLFGGWTRERRLEIMKDSHIGSYGTLALIAVGITKWAALSALLANGAFGAIIAAAVLSRAAMASVMAALPNARGAGLAQLHGRPSAKMAVLAGAVALGLALGATGSGVGLTLTLACACTAGAVAWIAHRRIGGQTGDILGAVQQLGEAAALVAATAMLSGDF